MRILKPALVLALVVGVASGAALAGVGSYGAWSSAVRVESIPGTPPDFNGAFLDGCPFVSRDGKTFFMASRRPTSAADQNTDINIWVSMRASVNDAWGAPVLVGPPVSIDVTASGATQINDFCPTLARNGHDFYFVSNRDGYCGTARNDDMYTTRWRGDARWDPAVHLGCDVNTPANEASPFPLPQAHSGPVLYFSSTITGNGDLYSSAWHGGAFEGREQVPGVNTSSWNEGQPNVRRDGLEIFYFSNQPDGIAGGNDIYSATRASAGDAFSGAADLGANVNSAASETRPSLSWDGTTLYFGSTRLVDGQNVDADHYVTTRDALTGSDG
jgi:WD40-like Beta Propeller Repeat